MRRPTVVLTALTLGAVLFAGGCGDDEGGADIVDDPPAGDLEGVTDGGDVDVDDAEDISGGETATAAFSGAIDASATYATDCTVTDDALVLDLLPDGFSDEGAPAVEVVVEGVPLDPLESGTFDATYRTELNGTVVEGQGQMTITEVEAGDQLLFNVNAQFEVDGQEAELTGSGTCTLGTA